MSTEGLDAVVRNNLTGGFNMLRGWMADNGGAIVNMIVDMWMGFLLALSAAFITGTCLRVDGGGRTRVAAGSLNTREFAAVRGFHLDSSPDLFREIPCREA